MCVELGYVQISKQLVRLRRHAGNIQPFPVGRNRKRAGLGKPETGRNLLLVTARPGIDVRLAKHAACAQRLAEQLDRAIALPSLDLFGGPVAHKVIACWAIVPTPAIRIGLDERRPLAAARMLYRIT